MFGYHDVTDDRDEAMVPPAFWITNAFDRSPAKLLRVSSPRWAPLTGGAIEHSCGEGRINLVQGGMVALPMPDLPTGVMRGRFHPTDGQLYACGLFAWAGHRTQPGVFVRIRRTAEPLCMPVAGVEVSSDGRTATLRLPEFAATWCYSVEWATRAADAAPVKGVLHGTLH